MANTITDERRRETYVPNRKRTLEFTNERGRYKQYGSKPTECTSPRITPRIPSYTKERQRVPSLQRRSREGKSHGGYQKVHNPEEDYR